MPSGGLTLSSSSLKKPLSTRLVTVFKCHCFADGFHLGRQGRIGLGKFFKGEPGEFCHHIVNGRLEARGSFARDVVFDLVEQAADGEFGKPSSTVDIVD